MGLLTCPKCGGTISDKAIICPHCTSDISHQNTRICEECNTSYNMHSSFCPNCGYPNSSCQKITQKKKRNGIVIFAVVISLIAVLLPGYFIFQKVQEAEYYSNMEELTYKMLNGAAEAENAANLIESVWYNAIYEKKDAITDKYTISNGKFVKDFNDAIDNLFSDEAFSDTLYTIKMNQAESEDLMKKLTNPPKKYEEAYEILKDYYNNYMKMTDLVIHPTGSLNTFSENFSNYDSETVNSFKKMKLYIE